MNAQLIARIRQQLDSGFSDEEVAADLSAEQEYDRMESLVARDEEIAAHGYRDDLPYAVGQYGPVNDAGERGM